jgi:hypothetical protein
MAAHTQYQKQTVLELARLVASLAMQLPLPEEYEDRIGKLRDDLVDLLEEAGNGI